MSDLCELPPDPGKSPGPWKRSKEDGNPPLSFRDVLMQVQHKGSCYLEISEPESEGFESDEWEEDEQQIHNQGPSNCPLVININGETKRIMYQPWRKSLIVKVLGKKVGYTFIHEKMWRPNGELTSLTWATTILKLTDGEDYKRALTGGPWMIANHYLTVRSTLILGLPWQRSLKLRFGSVYLSSLLSTSTVKFFSK